MQVDERNRQLLYVQKNRDSLKQDLATSDGVALPATREEFEALKRQLSAKAQEARSWLDGNEDEKVSRFGRVGELRERRTDISEELRHLRRQRSNIPSKLHAIRTSIAHQLGLSLADLPFVSELIDVNPNEAAWQPAIERLLGGRARTMLVERRHAEAHNEFLETRHLGERFEYDAVPDRVSVPGVALHEKSLVPEGDRGERAEPRILRAVGEQTSARALQLRVRRYPRRYGATPQGAHARRADEVRRAPCEG